MSHSCNVFTHLQRLALGPIAAALLSAAPAIGAEVRGFVALSAESAVPMLGYTQTRVAAASATYRSARGDAAVFLRVKESLPLPAPSTKWPVKVIGLRLEPSVIACAIDESLLIANHEKTPMTLSIGGEVLAPIAPGATLTYLCQQAGPQKIRVAEWPHVRALLYVGEVGVGGLPGPDGKFAVSAPDGKFSLGVIGADGLVTEIPVVIAGKDVDLGRLMDAKGAEGAKPGAEAPKPAPAPSRPPASAPPTPKPTPAGGDEIDLEQ